jgi:hypothetical protein
MMENNRRDRIDILFEKARSYYDRDPSFPEGFEHNLIERIRQEREVRGTLSLWVWRLVPIFGAIALILCVWDVAIQGSFGPDVSFAYILDYEDGSYLLKVLGGG